MEASGAMVQSWPMMAVGWMPGCGAAGGWRCQTTFANAPRGSLARMMARAPALSKSGGTMRQPAVEDCASRRALRLAAKKEGGGFGGVERGDAGGDVAGALAFEGQAKQGAMSLTVI